MNPTIQKLGHPATLIKGISALGGAAEASPRHPRPPVLAAKSRAAAYGQLSASAFAEQAIVVGEIERTLTAFTG
ncbi:MAG: hypothetical protein ABIQ32_12610 [Sphingomicrobium sp.]